MGAERRRGTCSDVSRGTWLKAPQGDTPRGRKVPDTDCDLGGNAQAEPDSESRIREIRPSGLMRGRNRSLRTNNCGRFNLVHPVPAYSTNGAFPKSSGSGWSRRIRWLRTWLRPRTGALRSLRHLLPSRIGALPSQPQRGNGRSPSRLAG